MWNFMNRVIGNTMVNNHNKPTAQGYHTNFQLGGLISNKEFPDFINRTNPHKIMGVEKKSEVKVDVVEASPPACCSGSPLRKRRMELPDKLHKKTKEQQQQQPEPVICPPTMFFVALDDSDDEDMVPVSMLASSRARKRTESVNSEDSFIVFCDGDDESDEEEEVSDDSSDSSNEDTEEEEENIEKPAFRGEMENGKSEEESSQSIAPRKKVHFADDDHLCKVHPMVKWSYAYHVARKGDYKKHIADESRFSRRINCTRFALGNIFSKKHRARIYEERFKMDQD